MSSKSKIEDHILPTEVLYHRNDNHYMSHDEDDVNKWVNEMKKWKFSNVTDVSDAISPDGFLNYVHGSNSIEVLYPDALPLKTFQQLFHFLKRLCLIKHLTVYSLKLSVHLPFS